MAEQQVGYQQIDGCVRMTRAGVVHVTEQVALEVPVSLSFNGTYYNVLSCTPLDLENLAYGVAFSNRIIQTVEDVRSIDIKDCGAYRQIDVRLRFGLQLESQALRLSSISGLPAGDSPVRLSPYYPARMVHLDAAEQVPASAIRAASQGLLDRQGMHRNTGATHAAAFVDRSGRFRFLSEDVGRHNAVDKLIGQLVRNGVDPEGGFAFLSSRCALELVNKLARYGIGVIATVSAPTSAVIEFATEANVTLCAFARDDRFTIYTHPERIAVD